MLIHIGPAILGGRSPVAKIGKRTCRFQSIRKLGQKTYVFAGLLPKKFNITVRLIQSTRRHLFIVLQGIVAKLPAKQPRYQANGQNC